MRIKRVTKEDLMNLAILRQELWPKYTLEHLVKDSQKNFLKDEEYPAFLAIDENDAICGFIECSIHSEAPGCKTDKIGYIEGWYVRKEYRRKGIGRLLVLTAEDWARNKGFIEMASDTNEDYPLSPYAHTSLGYIETDKPLHYKKVLK